MKLMYWPPIFKIVILLLYAGLSFAKGPPPQGSLQTIEPEVSVGPDQVGETPLDVCDCPEVEQLSASVRSILEEAYRNQGEVPPFSFDEFTVTLAIQLMSESPRDCLGLLSGSGAREYLEERGVLEEALPRAQIFSETGVPIPGGHVQIFREATTSGRTMIYHATINGEPRAFILRRNENAEVTVQMVYLQTPIEDLDLNGDVDEYAPPPFDPTLQVQTGPNSIQVERAIETDNGNVLRFRTGILETEREDPTQDTYQFNAGTTLTFGLDETIELSRAPGAPSEVNGREVEISADVRETRRANGEVLDQSYETELTYRNPDHELSVGVSGDQRRGDRVQLSFGNAGPDGREIEMLAQQGTVARPDLWRLDESPLRFGQMEGPQATPCEDPEGCEESPLSYYIEGSAPLGSGLDRVNFGIAHETEERTSFLTGSADFMDERYSLSGGTQIEDSRLSFRLEEDRFSGLDGQLFVERSRETAEGDQQTLTFGLTRDEDHRGNVTHGGSFDFTERAALQEEDLGDGFSLSVDERRQYGLEVTDDGELTLSTARFYGETYNLNVPDRGPAEVASYSNQSLASLTIDQSGDYSILAIVGESHEAIGDSRMWEIGIAHTETEEGRATEGRLRIANSEGVLRTPCQVVDLEASVSDPGVRSTPIRDLYIQDRGRTFRCRLRVSEVQGRRNIEMGFNSQVPLRNGGHMNRELLLVIRPDGTTATNARWGAEINF